MTRDEFNKRADSIRARAYKEYADLKSSGSLDPLEAHRKADDEINGLWDEVGPQIVAEEKKQREKSVS